MRKTTCSRRRGLRLVSILLLFCAQIGVFASPARAAGPTITTFYAATKAAYDAWNATTSTAHPPRTNAFPSGTTVVTFYFEFAGTKANSTLFKIVVHDHAGAVFVTHGPYTLNLAAGLHMSSVDAPTGKTYPDGAYTADLTVNGAVMAATGFTVGTKTAVAMAFYAATKAAADAWYATNSTAPPQQTTVFPVGTTAVAFYFHVKGAAVNRTQDKIVVRAQSGAVVATHGPFVLQYADGYYMPLVSMPSHADYPGGVYRADLLLDGVVAASTTFTVRATSSAVVTIFYPATKAALDAWTATTSTARPPRTNTFNAGAGGVAFYFEYQGATAKLTQYQIVIHDHTGAVLTTYGSYTLQHNAALAMRYVTAPHGSAYPNDSYGVDIVVDGRLAATTRFTVLGQGASIATFYAATKPAYDAWMASASAPPPPKTTTFPSGTTIVTVYFGYSGTVANSTLFTINILDHTGATLATHGPYTLSLGTGLHMSSIDAPAGKAYPVGAYSAQLLVDGHVASSISFAVGAAPAPPACSSSDVVATCIEPSILRLHANLPNNTVVEGTAFVIQSDSSGTYLLTNKHVIDGASTHTLSAISPDGHTYYPVLAIQATTADEGSGGDLAIVKLPPTSLRPLTWGDSDNLHLLQQVISIGYGKGLELPGPPTATEGTVSALHRDLGDGYGPIWIQHQSFINSGNSGGPLLDAHFAVVGVNTLSLKESQGIFFAIPSNTARQIALKLIRQIQGS